MIELPNHPYFVGCQFHPEFKSKPFAPHPLFAGFIKAAVDYRESTEVGRGKSKEQHYSPGARASRLRQTEGLSLAQSAKLHRRIADEPRFAIVGHSQGCPTAL